MAEFPEVVETRHLDVTPGRLLMSVVIEVSQPLPLGPPFGKLRVEAETLGELTIDIVVRPRFSNGCDGLLHGEVETVAWRRADVVAFESGRAWEYDVRTTRSWGPPGFVDDNG